MRCFQVFSRVVTFVLVSFLATQVAVADGEDTDIVFLTKGVEVSITIPEGFEKEATNQKQVEGVIMLEFVKKGESLERYTKLFTVQLINTEAEPKGFLNEIHAAYSSYPTAFIRHQRSGAKQGYPYQITLMGVGEVPAGTLPGQSRPVGDTSLYYAVKIPEGLLILHQTWRTQPFSMNLMPIKGRDISQAAVALRRALMLKKV